MLTIGAAVRVKDGKKGRPKKWHIVKFVIGDDVLNDIVVLENDKYEQLTVSLDDVVPYPVKKEEDREDYFDDPSNDPYQDKG